MDNKEILEKAISLALAGGWKYKSYDWRVQKDLARVLYVQRYTSDGREVYELEQLSVNDVIFNHDFAKALWGEGYEPDFTKFDNKDAWEVVDGKKRYMTVHDQEIWDTRRSGWIYHLQQSVMADDPIKYLGENMPTTNKGETE